MSQTSMAKNALCQVSTGATHPGTLHNLVFLLAQVSDFRKLVDGKIGDKHEEVMSRMGAIMAAGILDAGHQDCLALHVSASHTVSTGMICV